MLDLLLMQGLAAADTVVVVAARDSLDYLFGAVAGSVAVLAAFLLFALGSFWSFVRDARKTLSQAVSSDPGIQSLRKTAANLSSISDTVRGEVEHMAGSVSELSDRVSHLSRRLEERIEELNALIEVVQGEAEEVFVESASRARGLRAGLGAMKARGREGAHAGPRPGHAGTEAERTGAEPGRTGRTTGSESEDDPEEEDMVGEGV